jgi:hypothetical protein
VSGVGLVAALMKSWLKSLARWRWRWRCAGHGVGRSSCDYVTAMCVTTPLLLIDVSVIANVLVMAACERKWTCVPLAGVGLVVGP